ncbi:hypothetical protein [Variovorax sp. GrIS 2.14]|uniref:hypothetical protein n=1 Tax=Variovorax sp. GrIS 2.14 TaxID=3071709 RepID=UPI0038F7F143
MPKRASCILAHWNNIEPSAHHAHGAWQGRELTRFGAVPGVLWGRGYGQAQSAVVPRYLTLYGLRDTSILESRAYKRALIDSVPTSQSARPPVRPVARWVCRVYGRPAGEPEGDLMVRTLSEFSDVLPVVDRMAQVPGKLHFLLAERLQTGLPLQWLSAARRDFVRDQWLLCATASDCHPVQAAPDAVLFQRMKIVR